MQPPSLEPIRQAVSSGEWERANLLWNECAARLAEELSSRSLSEARLEEVRELVAWSRVVVLCERAHLQNQLGRLQTELHVVGEYELPKVPAAPRLVAASF